MFGFLKPARGCCSIHHRYRQVYAAFCAFHRQRYGVLASTLISYEAVFLYHLAVDSGSCSPPTSKTPTCCRLRNDPTNRWNLDRSLAGFCSDVGMLLAGVKVEDDVRDSNSLLARTANRLMGNKFKLAKTRIEAVSPGSVPKIEQLIRDHVESETRNVPIALDHYAKPTARAFALLFRVFGECCDRLGGKVKDDLGEKMGAIGYEIGRAILTADCFVDLERDRKQNHFNPIRSNAQKLDSARLALQSLSSAGWICQSLDIKDENGVPAVSPQVVRAAFDRVTSCLRRSEELEAKDSSDPLQSRPVLNRRFAARAGFCDCDCGGCDGCGDCGDLGCCDGDGAGASIGGEICLCGCFDCCVPCGDSTQSKQKSNPVEKRVKIPSNLSLKSDAMRTGITLGPLNPTGVVVIDGENFPAKSDGGFVADGSRVKVIDETSFGLIVSPLDEPSDAERGS